MLDDFFIRALLAGVMIAIVAGPLGCFVVWRRMAYFGDTLAHAALLGVAINIMSDLPIGVSVFAVSLFTAIALIYLQARTPLSADSLLGLLSHSLLAVGLVAISVSATKQIDVMSLLLGDILSVSRTDLLVVSVVGISILGIVMLYWNRFFALTVNAELFQAEQGNRRYFELVLVVLLACLIAMALKVIGVLLITSLLIIPAASARRLSSGPEQMALIAIAIGVISVVSGLHGSARWDTPSGPSIVVAAAMFFVLSLIVSRLFTARKV